MSKCEHKFLATGKGFVEASTGKMFSIYKCSICGEHLHKEDNEFNFFEEEDVA
jgi:hypothetical protein